MARKLFAEQKYDEAFQLQETIVSYLVEQVDKARAMAAANAGRA